MPVRFSSKLVTCLVFALLLASTFLLIGVPPTPVWVSKELIFAGAFAGLVVPLLCLPLWVWSEKRKKIDSTVVIRRLREGIAYLTGFGIAVFGWKKLMHLQFRIPLSFADQAASRLDGETLTWFYFGYSYPFAFIVGCLQIAGAFLLFFRRTRLVGAILLFPVMLNILLINIFYQMNVGALLQSVFLTLGVAYFIGLHAPALLTALFVRPQHNGNTGGTRKWISAIAVALLSFLFVRDLSARVPAQSPIYGRYNVKDLRVNGDPVHHTGRDSVLTKVYFDLDNVCVLEFNDQQRQLAAKYNLTEKPFLNIETIFADKNKSLPFRMRVDRIGHDQLSLKGHLAADSLQMILRKME